VCKQLSTFLKCAVPLSYIVNKVAREVLSTRLL
jgi:hypothetical protein